MTAKKSATKSAGRPFAKGHDPRRARGPKKGAASAGRPPLELADECRRLQRDVILAKCEQAIASLPVSSPAFQWAATWISRYGHSDAARRVALTIEDAEALSDEVLDALIGEGGE
jgi:hypothetical protein